MAGGVVFAGVVSMVVRVSDCPVLTGFVILQAVFGALYRVCAITGGSSVVGSLDGSGVSAGAMEP